jgi:hypothetical protein
LTMIDNNLYCTITNLFKQVENFMKAINRGGQEDGL